MSHLNEALPLTRRWPAPLTRDQIMLLLAAVNQLFLGLDTWLAHSISGTIRPWEWTPIVFGPVAGVLLLAAGLIALRWRGPAMAIAFATLMASVAVGLAGSYLHAMRAVLPAAPLGEQVAISLLVWAPPVLAPMVFALVGVLGMSAAWIERPPDSGRLALPGDLYLPMPFSKTRGYYLLVGLGILASLVTSVLDHARTGFASGWVWLALAVAAFGAVAALGLGLAARPTVADLRVYMAAMVLLIAVGTLGAVLHVQANLIGESAVVVERFVRGAPFLAPLLFADMGLLGLVAMMGPEEEAG